MSAEIEARVDALLMEQGVYGPIELLLAEGRLVYADYEAWRAGEAGCLDERIFGDIERTSEMLKLAADYAARLGLQSEHLSYIPWGGTPGQTLACSRDPGLDRLLRTRYTRADDHLQLDLFMDSGATALVNDVIAALVRRDPGEAERALHRLSDAEPGHSRLGQLERLVDAAGRTRTPAADAAAELELLEDNLLPLAEDLLGPDGRHFLAPLWRRLGEALAGARFDPRAPRLHASHIAERLGDWPGVIDATASEPSWQFQPCLLRRHARALERLRRSTEALGDWMMLCWSHPDQASVIAVEAAADWQVLWRDFLELDPELPTTDFPSWLLIQRPGLAQRLQGETRQVAPESFRCLLTVLCGGESGMEARRVLKELAPAVLHHYLSSLNCG